MLQYQQDLVVLQDKLRISNKKLEEYENRFKCQEETTQKLMLEYQARLEESEERLRRQQEDKEIQMKGIISRYGGGRRERAKLQHLNDCSKEVAACRQLGALAPLHPPKIIRDCVNKGNNESGTEAGLCHC